MFFGLKMLDNGLSELFLLSFFFLFFFFCCLVEKGGRGNTIFVVNWKHDTLSQENERNKGTELEMVFSHDVHGIKS